MPTVFTVRNLNDAGVDSLRAAIQGANASPDTHSSIVFQPMLSGIITLASALDPLKKDIDIGGRAGGGSITVQRDLTAGNFRIFEVTASSHSSINGLDIANGSMPTDNGGGVLNWGTLSLVGCSIRDNVAQAGGGIYNDSSSTLTVSACTIWWNQASDLGGGLSNYGQATISNGTEIFVNTAAFGGGISNSKTLSIIDDSRIYSNSASRSGGGICNQVGASLNMSSGRINNNGSSNFGGGIYDLGSVTLKDVSLTGNSSGTGGGFFLDRGATLTLNGCTVSGNTATVRGAGGVWMAGSTLTLINCNILDPIVQGP